MAIDWISKIKKYEEEEERKKEEQHKAKIEKLNTLPKKEIKSVLDIKPRKEEKEEVSSKKERPKFDYSNVGANLKQNIEKKEEKENI